MEKTYAPVSACERETQYGKLLNVTMFVADMVEFLKKHADNGVVRLTIGPRREPKVNAAGKVTATHSAWLDTWKPTQLDAPKAGPIDQIRTADDDQVPF